MVAHACDRHHAGGTGKGAEDVSQSTKVRGLGGGSVSKDLPCQHEALSSDLHGCQVKKRK